MDESINIASLIQDVISTASLISVRLENKYKSDLDNPVPEKTSLSTLTDYRLQLAQKVVDNILFFKNTHNQTPVDIIKCTEEPSNIKACLSVGPVINSLSGKKDVMTTIEEYASLRKKHIKTKDIGEDCEPDTKKMPDAITEVRIIKAVVCYDLLHKDITKPVTIMQTNSGTPENPDPLFRAAVKVLYNRSRVSCILRNFENGVKSSFYPELPNLDSTDFELLTNDAERRMIKKYVAEFIPMIERLNCSQPAKITANLWRFLLLLSQDYSVYYTSVRTLCDEHNRSYSKMHARIWMLKGILSIYDGVFSLLNLEPLDYV